MNKKKLAASLKRSKRKEQKKIAQGTENLFKLLDAAIDRNPDNGDDDDDYLESTEVRVFDKDTPFEGAFLPKFWEDLQQHSEQRCFNSTYLQPPVVGLQKEATHPSDQNLSDHY